MSNIWLIFMLGHQLNVFIQEGKCPIGNNVPQLYLHVIDVKLTVAYINTVGNCWHVAQGRLGISGTMSAIHIKVLLYVQPRNTISTHESLTAAFMLRKKKGTK